jgi:hypothetical protein
MSMAAVRRAAGHGMGIVFDSLSTPERVRLLVDAYRDAGGDRACILIRRLWMGTPPRDQMRKQVDIYRGYADPGAQTHWKTDEVIVGDHAADVADALLDVMTRSGADACNLRLHAPGIAPDQVRGQITAMADVVARIRAGQAKQRNGRPPL